MYYIQVNNINALVKSYNIITISMINTVPIIVYSQFTQY